MKYPSLKPAQAKRLCVLKFGSSVLRAEEDYGAVALEVYRHVRDGEKVVAVVSALFGETDALLSQGARVGGHPPALLARVARVGELHSAALMALALSRLGIRACTMDPHEMGLVAEGDPLDANLSELDANAVLGQLEDHEVVVVPGFTAGHAEHGVVTLGRGGTDLSAVFFAARLDAHRVRLIKDVDGVYDEDPARNPFAERFSQLGYAEAAEASTGLIQPKAIHAAAVEDVLIEVASLGAGEATTIANLSARKSLPVRAPKMRVSLLGCGAVGAGILSFLQERPDLFDLNPVLVRHPDRHHGAVQFTADPAEALSGDPDMVIELLGGADYPATLICSALRAGASVVTANKAALAKHYGELHASARAGGALLAYSGAVGGGAPILEAVARLGASSGVVAIEGVMNGTANFLLGRLAAGQDFDAALAEAQRLGFAETDPSADVDGHDTADKLSLLAHECFGVALPPETIAKQSLRGVSGAEVQAALLRGEPLKQIGRCRVRSDGSVEAEVRIACLPAAHPLAGAVNEENRFVITDGNGELHEVYGKGAGRWPTAAAVFADVMDVQRSFRGRVPEALAVVVPMRMSA